MKAVSTFEVRHIEYKDLPSIIGAVTSFVEMESTEQILTIAIIDRYIADLQLSHADVKILMTAIFILDSSN